MSSGEGSLGVCDACCGYITEKIDGRPYVIPQLTTRGYNHTLCQQCSITMHSYLKLINFIIALHTKNSIGG